jgi:hypothetical protein
MRTAILGVLTCAAALAAAACDGGGTVDETRVLPRARHEQAAPPASAAARMRLESAERGFVHPPMRGGEGPGAGPLRWKAPEGWVEGAPRQMRVVTFQPASEPRVECYVTVLGGAAGGVEANVNRWREQLRLAPLPADAIAALPTLQVLGRASPFVEIDGGKAAMLGLVCELDEQCVFVKMTGPADAVRAERERFAALCTSLAQP